MYRLNVKITEEAAAILKAEAERIGTTMGTVVTLWALNSNQLNNAMEVISIYKQEKGKPAKPTE